MAGLLGAASRQRQTAMLPSQQFHCLLEELPLHLIPRRSLKETVTDPPQDLFLNPDCQILPAGHLPEEFRADPALLQGFALRNTIAWVRDPATQALYPFWLGPRLEAAIANLHPAEPVPASLPQPASVLLDGAHILVPADYAAERRAKWHTAVANLKQNFHKSNYVPLADLIHPYHIAALRRYYRYAIRRGTIRLGDEQSSRRYVAHNDPVARYFHHQIAKVLADVVGEPIKPSYVYMASYLSGAELKKHTDREQCEFSVTLCLDFSPEPDLATTWPIQLETLEGTATIYQALGDGLVYRGTRVPHYRSVLAEGRTSTSIFFHYVAEDFSGPLD
jgi:hypothetical protein